MPQLVLPSLRPDQRAIAIHPAKYKTIVMGRRWGKTVLGGVLAVNTLAQHGKVAWIAPTYKNTRPMWRWVTRVCAGHPGIAINKSERTLETNRGGLLAIYSGDNADAVLGEAFHLAIVDEAARITENIVTDTIMPTLADYNGDLITISTPKGKNWFYHYYLRGKDGKEGYASWQAPTANNPIPAIQHAAEAAKTLVPERTYRQEWLAEFIEDGGEVFRNVRLCAIAKRQNAPIEGHNYVIGVDPGKRIDPAVFVVWDVTLNHAVYMDRMVGIDYELQRLRLEALVRLFRPTVVVVEVNNTGDPFIEQLRRISGMPILEFQTTNATKSAIIESLALQFEQQSIGILDEPDIIAEMEAFTMERLPSGLMRYAAPEGLHDDIVMAHAFAAYGANQHYEEAGEVNYAEPFEFSSSNY